MDAGFRLQPNEMFLRVRAWDTAGGDGDYAIDRGTDYALKYGTNGTITPGKYRILVHGPRDDQKNYPVHWFTLVKGNETVPASYSEQLHRCSCSGCLPLPGLSCGLVPPRRAFCDCE